MDGQPNENKSSKKQGIPKKRNIQNTKSSSSTDVSMIEISDEESKRNSEEHGLYRAMGGSLLLALVLATATASAQPDASGQQQFYASDVTTVHIVTADHLDAGRAHLADREPDGRRPFADVGAVDPDEVRVQRRVALVVRAPRAADGPVNDDV